eukprot:5861921-Amphidinium_carterae.1
MHAAVGALSRHSRSTCRCRKKGNLYKTVTCDRRIHEKLVAPSLQASVANLQCARNSVTCQQYPSAMWALHLNNRQRALTKSLREEVIALIRLGSETSASKRRVGATRAMTERPLTSTSSKPKTPPPKLAVCQCGLTCCTDGVLTYDHTLLSIDDADEATRAICPLEHAAQKLHTRAPHRTHLVAFQFRYDSRICSQQGKSWTYAVVWSQVQMVTRTSHLCSEPNGQDIYTYRLRVSATREGTSANTCLSLQGGPFSNKNKTLTKY